MKRIPRDDAPEPTYPKRKAPSRLVAALRGAAGAAAAVAAFGLAGCGARTAGDTQPVTPPGEPTAPAYDRGQDPAATQAEPAAGGATGAVADADGDGVGDAQDQCPQVPEDGDAYDDADGCPDPDNDQDGVPDLNDRCPYDAEPVDGFQDEDGCPDQR